MFKFVNISTKEISKSINVTCRYFGYWRNFLNSVSRSSALKLPVIKRFERDT